MSEREFGLLLLKLIGEERARTLKILRDADAIKFQSYMGGYEQASHNIEKLIVAEIQRSTGVKNLGIPQTQGEVALLPHQEGEGRE